jgi:phage tail sheath protein FI
LTALDTITQNLILNVPGVTAATEVNGIITYAEGRGDVFVVVDALNDTVSAQLTRAAAYTSSSYAAVYYPNLVIPDPTSSAPNAITTVSNGAAVMGRYVATDASRGVFKSPAGLEARLSGVVSVAQLTNSDLDALNSASAPVNAIRYVPGSGIVVMGARTLKPGYADRYVSVRRSLIFIKKSLEELTGFAIFEPNDERLWNRLTSTVETFLTDFWQQGGLRGLTPADAFYVKCDE